MVEKIPSPVAGIVLAAGRSSRMGESKALLELDGTTFLERGLSVLTRAGCQPVLAVVPPGEEGKRMADLTRRSGADAVPNPETDAEQIDSLRHGLEALGADVVAAVVLPVDHPRVRASTVAALLGAHRERGARIIRPVHEDRPGHPVLFSRDLWSELEAPDLEHGARDVVHRHHAEIEEIAVDDSGITVDINTPEQYAREVKLR